MFDAVMFEAVVGGVLALAVVLAWVRLWGERGGGRRWWGLMALQPIAGALLWLALFPPSQAVPEGVLVVAGRGAPSGAYDVRLPEAGAAVGGAFVPDMATALRQRGAAQVRLVGEGLEVRDVAALRGVGLVFDAPPLPRGLVRMGVGGPVTAGGMAEVFGVANGLAGGRALLFDPAGRQAGSAPLGADGGFVVRGRVQAAGPADWQLRLMDGAGAVFERAVVPVVAREASAVRLWVRAGAPGAELKYVQRWALDAGLDFASTVALGAGVRVGDALAMNAAALRRVDVLVLDERSWAGLSAGERGAVLAAVRQGMGLILRVTGPVSSAVGRQWADLGLGIGPARREVRLAGGGRVQALRLSGRGGVPWLRGADGAPVAVWQPLGRGRVTVWPVQDAFALVLAGDGDVFAELWSAMVAAVARPLGAAAVLPDWGFVGERVDVCGLAAGNEAGNEAGIGTATGPGEAVMVAPGGRVVALVVDPAARGCAGYWPTLAGWHQLRLGQGAAQWLRVLPDEALPGVRAAARRDAALMIAGAGLRDAAGVRAVRTVRVAAWPWWLAFIVAAGLLWWLERRR